MIGVSVSGCSSSQSAKPLDASGYAAILNSAKSSKTYAELNTFYCTQMQEDTRGDSALKATGKSLHVMLPTIDPDDELKVRRFSDSEVLFEFSKPGKYTDGKYFRYEDGQWKLCKGSAEAKEWERSNEEEWARERSNK